ncbi:MAG: transposase [Anaerolineae bacterium]|jgi:transposase
MKRYIGIDVHTQSCTLAVMSQTGKRLKAQVVETTGEALLDAIQGIKGELHVCLEEGTQSAWVYSLLDAHVAEVIVAVPQRKNGPKNDERDAWELAEALRLGAVKTFVYKAPLHLIALRNAVRAHTMAVSDVTRAKNRLRAVFRSRGVPTDRSVYNPERRADWLEQLAGSHRTLAEWLCRKVEVLELQRTEAEEWLLKEAKTHPIVRTLRTAPGMGPIRTAQCVAITVTPYRFRTRRQYWSYSGLAVVTRSSSDWAFRSGAWQRASVPQTCGLNRQRQPLLKAIFKGAAMTVIAQPEHPLCHDYVRMLDKGIKPNLARLTLARRIAAIVLSMWKHQEEYDPKKHMSRPPQP